jgi:superfamily II DNA or RNA helicase
MADEHASPFSPVVVASVQTLCREARLTGFSDCHFQQVIADEGHHAIAKSFAKVLNYFHFGAESLAEEWQAPPMGVSYVRKSDTLAVTATPELNSKRSLGEWFEIVAYQYQLMQAIADGWLVPIVTKNIPLNIDLRGLKAGRTPNGSDLKAEDVSKRLIPVLEALAEQICELASDRKTIAFVPSVECARLLAAAVERHGLRGIFVSGQCLDVDEKTDEYRKAGPGTVLVNCALYVEGADFPDTSCVAICRATKSSGFFRQMVGRGTRVLPNTVDGLPTPDERRAAIAASAKPNLLLIDPLWRIDTMDLCDVYDLYTDKPEIKEKMKALGPPSEESAREAERDFIKALEKEAKKHARKAARTIDPIAWGLSIGDAAITNYTPVAAWEMQRPSATQIEFMQKNRIEHSQIKYKGLAQRVITRYIARLSLNLATAEQLSFLKKLGFDEQQSATMTKAQASQAISTRIRR